MHHANSGPPKVPTHPLFLLLNPVLCSWAQALEGRGEVTQHITVYLYGSMQNTTSTWLKSLSKGRSHTEIHQLGGLLNNAAGSTKHLDLQPHPIPLALQTSNQLSHADKIVVLDWPDNMLSIVGRFLRTPHNQNGNFDSKTPTVYGQEGT